MESKNESTVYLLKFHRGYFSNLHYGHWKYTNDPCLAMRYSTIKEAEKHGKSAEKYHYGKTTLHNLSYTIETWKLSLLMTKNEKD